MKRNPPPIIISMQSHNVCTPGVGTSASTSLPHKLNSFGVKNCFSWPRIIVKDSLGGEMLVISIHRHTGLD